MDPTIRRPGSASNDDIHAQEFGKPSWWNETNDSTWERVKAAFRRDWEQTKHDFGKDDARDLDQNVDDTVTQAVGQRPIPPEGVPNPPEADEFDRYEPAFRYGYGAAGHYGQFEWDPQLERTLEQEWRGMSPDSAFTDSRDFIRQGWDFARRQRRP